MFKETDNNTFVFVKDQPESASNAQNQTYFDLIKDNNYIIPKKTVVKASLPDVGLGVFATEDIEEGEIIESCSLILLGWRSNYHRDPQILRYAFSNTACKCKECQEHGNHLFLMTGNGMLYNHADTPNTSQKFNFKNFLLSIIANRRIKKGEEIFISYGESYFTHRPKIDIEQNQKDITVPELVKPQPPKYDGPIIRKRKKAVKEPTLKIKENGIIKEIDNFISDEDSNYLIELAKKDFHRMTVLGSKPVSDYRVADGTWLSNSDPKSKEIREKISNIVNIPVENMEQTHIVKYDVGGEYKTHHDFFHENTDYYKGQVAKGGQRILSALIYLNDNFEGGETEFPKLKRTIKPKKNKLVIWKNVKDNGDLDHDSLHAGLPVKKGIKYICIIWIREKQFV